jgi:phosphatidylglycerol:prolipoprotein diacylglycerol transferase
MLPSINFGILPTYYIALLTGIVIGWILFLTDDYETAIANRTGSSNLFLKSTLSYILVVIFCIQGANYFHYFFDNIPAGIKDRLTTLDILLTSPLNTTKVLYGTFFFYPLGIYCAALITNRKKFYNYLNQKTFILLTILGFARIGCFCNGCCYGIRSELFGITFPMGSSVSSEHLRRGFTNGFVPPESLSVIPTQLISAVILFIFALMSWRSHKRHSRNNTFFIFLFCYAVFRFLIEFLRDDLDRAYWVYLSASQWISLFIFLCVGLYFTGKKWLNKNAL